MSKACTIYSITEQVSIDTFKHEFTTLRDSCFNDEELQELEERPLQSKAGVYAIKKALVNLYKTLLKAEQVTEKMFIISHKKNGAPRIKKAPNIPKSLNRFSKKNIHISISHNRDHAYGLAAIQENMYG